MTINLDKQGTSKHTLTSPRWPSKYSHNQDCKWVVVVPSGKVTLTFQSFNVEWSNNCRKKDYLFVGQILTYSNTYLCGNTIPKGTQFKSKNQQMTLKFHSNSKVTRAGFKVILRAT